MSSLQMNQVMDTWRKEIFECCFSLSCSENAVIEGEVFQVKKSSHSKKVAKKLRERARKERQHEEVAQHYKEMTDERTMDTKATGRF